MLLHQIAAVSRIVEGRKCGGIEEAVRHDVDGVDAGQQLVQWLKEVVVQLRRDPLYFADRLPILDELSQLAHGTEQFGRLHIQRADRQAVRSNAERRHPVGKERVLDDHCVRRNGGGNRLDAAASRDRFNAEGLDQRAGPRPLHERVRFFLIAVLE